MPDQPGRSRLWLGRLEFSCPERRPAPEAARCFRLITHSKDSLIHGRIRDGANEEADEGVTEAREATLDCKVIFSTSSTQIIIFRISVSPTVKGQDKQTKSVHDVRLAAVVLTDEHCEVGPQLHRDICT